MAAKQKGLKYDLCGRAIMIDLDDRDPNEINKHLTVRFEDVIGEPKPFHSFGCVWDSSKLCYGCWFQLCYQVPVLCCGCCLAMGWGCEFAYMACMHVWWVTPFIKWFQYMLYPFRCLWGFAISCCVRPWCESCGYLFEMFDESGSKEESLPSTYLWMKFSPK